MTKPRLRNSPVIFNKIPHTYEYNGKSLKGVTTILHEMPMFAEMYETKSSKALRDNKAWAESGYSISEITYTVYEEDEYGNKINISVMPSDIDNFAFLCSNTEREELVSLIKNAQREQIRIEENKFFASLRGTEVHNACEYSDEGTLEKHLSELSDSSISHATTYTRLRNELGLRPFKCEYLVSDNEHVASSIDLVLLDENDNIVIADIKCVSKMDDLYIKYLSFQLSIYKYLFELQNPNKKVHKMYGVWLPQKESYGKAKMFEVSEVPRDEIITLLEHSHNGITYNPESEFTLPAEINASFEDYIKAKIRIKKDKEFVDNYEKQLYDIFETANVKKFEIDNIATFTRTLPSTSQKFDTSAFKESEPELYSKYMKTTQTKGSLRVTIKNQ